MDYITSIGVALLTFISPCVLPLLPVFVSYFAAGEAGKKRTLINALGFALGLFIVLMLVGLVFAFVANAAAVWLDENKTIVNIVTGSIIAILGLNFIGIIKLPFLNASKGVNVKTQNLRFFSSVLLGLVYALSFGPCIVTFGSFSLVTVLERTIASGNILGGILLHGIYTVTLCALFVICALLIDLLKGVMGFIKRHYKIINIISGSILVILGILIATGVMAKFSALFI